MSRGELRAVVGEGRLEWLKTQAAALEISEAELLRRIIDISRAAPGLVPPPVAYPLPSVYPPVVHQSSTGGDYRGGSSPSLLSSPEGGGIREGGGVLPGREGEEESPQNGGKSTGKRRKPRVEEAPVPVLPLEIDSPELQVVLKAFAEYRRREKREPMTQASWTLLVNGLRQAGRENAPVAVRFAMNSGWKTWKPSYGTDFDEMRSLLGLPPPPPKEHIPAQLQAPPARTWYPRKPVLMGGELCSSMDGSDWLNEERWRYRYPNEPWPGQEETR